MDVDLETDGGARSRHVSRATIEGVSAIASLVIVALTALTVLSGWQRNEDALYADPFGCRTQLCARMTTSASERRVVERALDLVKQSRFARSAPGSSIARAAAALDDDEAINVWSLRQLEHSRFDRRRGIMINRVYDDLSPELVAVMIVHEASHLLLEESTYESELVAYGNMLTFYEEIRDEKAWAHRELEHLVSLNRHGGLARQLPCRAIFRGECPTAQ